MHKQIRVEFAGVIPLRHSNTVVIYTITLMNYVRIFWKGLSAIFKTYSKILKMFNKALNYTFSQHFEAML